MGSLTGSSAADCCRRANRLREAAEPENALKWLAQALLNDPTHRPGLLGLGATLHELGRTDEAVRAYERALRLYPDDPAARAALRTLQEEHTMTRVTRGGTEPDPGDSAAAAAGRRPAPTTAAGQAAPTAPPTPARRPARASFVAPRTSGKAVTAAAYGRARILGLLAYPALLAAYIIVGLRTHFTVGLAAAAAVGLAIAAFGSLFFAPARGQALRGMLHGMMWGVGFTLAVGLVSILIALSRAAVGAAW